MTRIDAILAMRTSAMDALLTLHDRLCVRPVTVQQLAELQAWVSLHKAACTELQLLLDVGVIRDSLLHAAEQEAPTS